MTFSIIGNEHTARQVATYLEKEGHGVELTVDTLGPGTNDPDIASYALDTDRLILTSDTDFLHEHDSDDHAGVLFQPDDKLSPYTVAMIVTEISTQVNQGQIDTVFYVTEDWL